MKKKLLFLANVTCTDYSNHHKCNLDPDLNGRHDDRDPNTSEDRGDEMLRPKKMRRKEMLKPKLPKWRRVGSHRGIPQ